MLGKTVSHYEVTHCLGAGGMGEVYAARDMLLGRRVAIKILQTAGVVTEESRLRFLQEARAASALNHPNIVTIYDIVREQDMDCIVMELVEGETLDVRKARGPVPLQEALEIIDKIADALATTHQQGIVHRDLKPGNVMLTPSGGVKVLDFGLAKLLAELPAGSNTPASPRTQSGFIVGTPAYMSPEQVKGQPVDGRSDIFTLGTIAFELLTGANPFEADSVVATMHNIAYDDLPPVENLPAAATGLVARMLAKDREQRFQSASDLRSAIADLRAGRTVAEASATPPTLVIPQKPPSPSWRRAAIAAAVVTVLALGIGASQLWRMRTDPPRGTSRAAEIFTPPKTAHDHVRRANELLGAFWRKGYVDSAIAEYQRAIALEASHAPAHAGLAMAYLRKYYLDVDRDPAWLDLATKNARHAVSLDAQLAGAHVALAVAELNRGNTDAARKELEQTLLRDPGNAAAHRWLGDAASRLKDNATAEAELKKAIELRPRDAELHSALGAFFYKTARYKEAEGAFRQAAAIAPDYAPAYRNLGAVLHMLGDYAGAATAMQQSLEIEPSATVYSNLGTLYFFQGLYPQSVTAFEKAVQLGSNDHVVWANLGDAYRWTPGNQPKAREAFTAALQLVDEAIRTHPDDATLQSRKALYLAKRGDVRSARATADALIARNETNPQNLYRLALAFELTGARDKSLAALEKAIRNGYSTEEIKVDPELASLRRDVQYRRMMVAVR